MSTKDTVSQPARKRAKPKSDNGDVSTSAPAKPQRATLTTLPIELLAEILLLTCSPPTVLAVSRTCSYLNRSLAHNPAASFIWRGVRETCKPLPLPEPGKAWKRSEAEYAAFVFDGGRCEVCQKNTHAMYVSFATRIRLCGSHFCMKKFTDEYLIDVTIEFFGQDRQSIWAPYVESNQLFRSRPPAFRVTWPYNTAVLFRKTDWERFKRDLLVYTSVEKSKATSKRTTAPLSGLADGGNDPTSQVPEDESMESVLRRCHAAVVRFPDIMSLSVQLLDWRIAYDNAHRRIKNTNQSWSNLLAVGEGWNTEDLLMTDAYGSLFRRKSSLLEEIEMKDVTAIRPDIESQLLERQARRNRQKAEATYKQKLAEVKKIYDGMRCGTLKGVRAGPSGQSDPGHKMILPPLHVFCEFPSVRTLKGRPDPSVLPPEGSSAASSNLKSSPLATSLIVSDIQTWLIPVKSYLMGLLGYPDGWQSASTRKISPLERVTARFLCRRCRDGGVGKRYQREGCLDFRGVCSHVCLSTKRKINQDKEQGREGERHNEHTDSEDEHESVEVKTTKKNKERTYDWKVEVFEKDEKAIRLINKILNLLGLSEEDPDTASVLNNVGGRIRCKSCKGWIVMDFDTAIGHAHRHEDMDVAIAHSFVPPMATVIPEAFKGTLLGPHDSTSNPLVSFQRGVTQRILGPAYRARKLRSKVNYGCKHCIERGAKAMDFNALRSHVKAKHGIQDIGDEDIFYYSQNPLGG